MKNPGLNLSFQSNRTFWLKIAKNDLKEEEIQFFIVLIGLIMSLENV